MGIVQRPERERQQLQRLLAALSRDAREPPEHLDLSGAEAVRSPEEKPLDGLLPFRQDVQVAVVVGSDGTGHLATENGRMDVAVFPEKLAPDPV